jgi:hypothetical protein
VNQVTMEEAQNSPTMVPGTSLAVVIVCEIPTFELNYSFAIQLCSSLFLVVFSNALTGISLLGEVNLCHTN